MRAVRRLAMARDRDALKRAGYWDNGWDVGPVDPRARAAEATVVRGPSPWVRDPAREAFDRDAERRDLLNKDGDDCDDRDHGAPLPPEAE